MTTDQLVSVLQQNKIVPVIALENPADIVPIGQALKNGGLNVAEITFRAAGADEAIQTLRAADPDMLIGAGTVLTVAQVDAARAAGADFIVTPGFNPKVVAHCLASGIPVTPGVNNPMAIEAALDLGLETVKFFPAEASGGVAMLKALLAPYPMLKIMPTGGIHAGNIQQYWALKNVIACGGSWMVGKALIQAQNWAEIARLTREAVSGL